ncbi:hypothetical protein BGX38DRAFT_896779 [Terfezia claveryi]|nr:hypothetical protein BGX38DRAFT_896779 [Terfezia claveryi]
MFYNSLDRTVPTGFLLKTDKDKRMSSGYFFPDISLALSHNNYLKLVNSPLLHKHITRYNHSTSRCRFSVPQSCIL